MKTRRLLENILDGQMAIQIGPDEPTFRALTNDERKCFLKAVGKRS